MNIVQWLLLPAFVHVAWVTALAMRMGRARVRAAQAGEVRIEDIALDSSRWPDEIRKISNNYDNQFQLPVLYYAILPLLIVMARVDWLMVALGWVFVASRIAHSLVHTGGNVVVRRLQAFLMGFIAITFMWAWFAVRIYLIG